MKRLLGIFSGLLLCAMLVGCGEETGSEMTLYYLNPEKNGLEQSVYYRQAEEGDASVREVLSAVPLEVEIQEYQMEHETLKFFFDKSYEKMSRSEEVLFRASMVQTMVQLPDVNYVSFYVDEEPLMDAAGNQIGLMKAEDFLQNVGSSLKSYQTTDLTLYFANKGGTGLVLEQRSNVHYAANTLLEKLVVESLMKGTTSEQRSNTIADTVKLLGVTVRDGICYVNFDSEFLTAGYNQAPEIPIYSIVNSIIANGTVDQVQILVDGSNDIVYKGTVDLKQPLSWKAGMIGG